MAARLLLLRGLRRLGLGLKRPKMRLPRVPQFPLPLLPLLVPLGEAHDGQRLERDPDLRRADGLTPVGPAPNAPPTDLVGAVGASEARQLRLLMLALVRVLHAPPSFVSAAGIA